MPQINSFLRGVRIVDLSRYLPGPLATMLLADLGAEVIKVEPPSGDPMGDVGPRLPDGRGLWHQAVNAGKCLVHLDLKTSNGQQALLELLTEADVLVESFRPGVMSQLGLDLDMLRQKFPRLICLSLSGYGQEGSLSDQAGHDNNYLSQAGFLAGVGPSRDQPTLVDPPIADCLGSMFGLSSILAALLARERDGHGCHIDIALADVALPLLTFGLSGVGMEGVNALRAQGPLNGGWACYSIYQTADGVDAVLGAVEAKFWSAFCTAAGRQDWIQRHGDPLPQTSLRAEVAAFFKAHRWEDIEQQFSGVDCCLSRSLSLDEATQSTYHRDRQLLVPSPSGLGYQALFPAKVDGLGPVPRQALRPWRST